ncbi:hypothetical protein [Janthinobacterium sp. ZB1P44]|uniref:hypothetical protein n=1 Tax=Janthinobacterium sp. ZB1P44 TaxID=3424192 RepID=UPI003F204957
MHFFGDTNKVTFRNLMKLTTTLDTGRLSNAVTVNYRNGYTDAAAAVYDVAAAKEVKGFRLQVPSYTTFDWQARFAFDKQTTIRAGIKNCSTVHRRCRCALHLATRSVSTHVTPIQ